MLNAKDVETVERGREHNFRKKQELILHTKKYILKDRNVIKITLLSFCVKK